MQHLLHAITAFGCLWACIPGLARPAQQGPWLVCRCLLDVAARLPTLAAKLAVTNEPASQSEGLLDTHCCMAHVMHVVVWRMHFQAMSSVYRWVEYCAAGRLSFCSILQEACRGDAKPDMGTLCSR